ncbi:MAG: twin-arginine translocation pathway signal protein, partial [Verrucomicrobia bacterium]
MTRKAFFLAATAAATIFLCNQPAWPADDLADIKEQITRQHDQSVKRLQDWIHQVSIAAENRGYPEGADYMIKLLQEAGFDQARQVPTQGKPGVFATLDAGAP